VLVGSEGRLLVELKCAGATLSRPIAPRSAGSGFRQRRARPQDIFGLAAEPGIPWAHFDVMARNPRSRPGRSEGAEATALRALRPHRAAVRV